MSGCGYAPVKILFSKTGQIGTSLAVQWLEPHLLRQVLSLVRELRSHMPSSQKTKTQNRSSIVTNSMKTLKTVHHHHNKIFKKKKKPEIYSVSGSKLWWGDFPEALGGPTNLFSPHDGVFCRIPRGLSLPLSPHLVFAGVSQLTSTPLSARSVAGQDDPVCLWQCAGSGPAPVWGMYVGKTTELSYVVSVSCLTLLKGKEVWREFFCLTEEVQERHFHSPYHLLGAYSVSVFT